MGLIVAGGPSWSPAHQRPARMFIQCHREGAHQALMSGSSHVSKPIAGNSAHISKTVAILV